MRPGQRRPGNARALKKQHEDARIFAVGDDWQSVFRFTSSDIHLMRNFGKAIGGTFDSRTSHPQYGGSRAHIPKRGPDRTPGAKVRSKETCPDRKTGQTGQEN